MIKLYKIKLKNNKNKEEKFLKFYFFKNKNNLYC